MKKTKESPAVTRVRRRRESVREAGGRALYVVLKPEATKALEELVEAHGTITAAVEYALGLATRAKAVEVRPCPRA